MGTVAPKNWVTDSFPRRLGRADSIRNGDYVPRGTYTRKGHMTRKDFQLIASIIRAEKESGGDGGTLAMVAERFSQQLGNLNPNFKPDTFFTACGMPNGEWVI